MDVLFTGANVNVQEGALSTGPKQIFYNINLLPDSSNPIGSLNPHYTIRYHPTSTALH